MNDQTTKQTEKKCPCGRPIADEKEHAAAHAAGKCSFCFDFCNYAKTLASKLVQS